MFQYSLVNSAGKAIKIILLIALIVLGIVFMPNDFIVHLQERMVAAGESIKSEFSGRWPGISHEFNIKFVAAREEAGTLYQSVKEKFSQTIGNWIWEKLNGAPR